MNALTSFIVLCLLSGPSAAQYISTLNASCLSATCSNSNGTNRWPDGTETCGHQQVHPRRNPSTSSDLAL